MTPVRPCCFVGISTSRPKSEMCTTRACGRTGYSFLDLKELPCNTSKVGVLLTRFACTKRKAVITPGGTIVPAHFVATSACGSITCGCRRRWPSEAKPRGSTKSRGSGTGPRIMRRWCRSLTEYLRASASRSSRRSERVMEAAAHDINNQADNNQHRPNHHDVFDVELAGVHPAPDKGPDAAGNNPDNSVYHAGVLKLLDQNHDEAN